MPISCRVGVLGRLELIFLGSESGDVTSGALPPRPRWWGPDWRTLPLALWLTVVVNAVAGFVVAYFVLRHVAPGLFDASQRTLRGGNRGEELAAALGGASTFPAMWLWSRAVRRRGWRANG